MRGLARKERGPRARFGWEENRLRRAQKRWGKEKKHNRTKLSNLSKKKWGFIFMGWWGLVSDRERRDNHLFSRKSPAFMY